MSTNGINNQPYIPPVNKTTDAERLDFATSQFLKLLQEDKRVAEAHQRNEEEKRRQRGQDLTPADPPKRPGQTPAQARARGEPVPARPVGSEPPVAPAPTPPGPLVSGQSRIDPAPLVAERAPRGAPPLPTGAPQQPPSTGGARAPIQASAAQPTLAAAPLTGLPPGLPQLSIVDTRTLGLLAGNAAAAPTGRLVGPIQPPSAPVAQALDAAGPLVGPVSRGLGLTPRSQPPALNATTPAPVRERIDKAVATGVLDTAPLRFPPLEPLAGVDPAAPRGTPRAAPLSPLARSVGAKPSAPPQPTAGEPPLASPIAAAPPALAPANDVGPAREAANPFAANDAPVSLGLALFQDVSRRGSAPTSPQPAAPPPPTLVQQTGAGMREAVRSNPPAVAKPAAERRGDARTETGARGPAPIESGVPAAKAPEREGERTGAPMLLGVPGLGARRP